MDVLASADADTLDRGVAQRLLDPASRRDFAANALVVVAPAGSALPLAGLADLAAPGVRRVAPYVPNPPQRDTAAAVGTECVNANIGCASPNSSTG